MLPRLPAAKLSSPGLRFCERDQLRQRVDAERRRGRDHHRMLADEADRHEIAHHVDREIGLQLRQRDEVGGKRHIERVAVRRGGDATAWIATAPAPPGWLMHDHLLAPQPGQMVGEDPRDARRARRPGRPR